jgi:hypothetical protein
MEHLPTWSLVVGLIQWAGGLALMVWGYFRFMARFAELSAGRFWDKAQTDVSVDFDDKLGFFWSGMVGYFSFLFTPVAWLALLIILQGLCRFTLALGVRRACGSLWAYPLLSGLELLRSRRRSRRRLKALGQEVPDRVEENCDPSGPWRLRVTSARDKTWRPVEAIRIEEQLYELVEVRESVEQNRLRLVYSLRPWPSNRLVRTVVDYQPPPRRRDRRPPPVAGPGQAGQGC